MKRKATTKNRKVYIYRDKYSDDDDTDSAYRIGVTKPCRIRDESDDDDKVICWRLKPYKDGTYPYYRSICAEAFEYISTFRLKPGELKRVLITIEEV